MRQVWISGIGIYAPGLENWRDAAAMLSGDVAYQRTEISFPKSELLPANERRRCSNVIKLALHAAGQIDLAQTGRALETICVFASSLGDSEIADHICQALTMPDKPVSPTQFHNSVHNAAAGYWSIGMASQQASTAISAYDGSFVAGLLEAVSVAAVRRQPVLLVAYDIPAPVPLREHIDVSEPFAVALRLDAVAGMCCLNLQLQAANEAESAMMDAELEQLRRANPAARCLPLLSALARQQAQRLWLPYIDGLQLAVQVGAPA